MHGRHRRRALPRGRGTLTADRRILVAPDAATRIRAAEGWIASHPPDAEILVIAPSWEAADDLVRVAVRGPHAPPPAAAGRAEGPAGPGVGVRFGVVRTTLERLASRLAAPGLAATGRVPASPLALLAVAARATHRLRSEEALPYFAEVAGRPGFPAAVVRTLGEIRMNGLGADALAAIPGGCADLARLAAGVERELEEAGLADRSAVFKAAVAAVEAAPKDASAPLGRPLLLLDPRIETAREAALVAALAARAPAALATLPAGTPDTAVHRLEAALGTTARPGTDAPKPPDASASLAALQAHLFEDTAIPAADADGSVRLQSWPGEARECVEIARHIQDEAARGTPFDRIAIFLRSPFEYRPHLEEALRRAEIPAFFARGATRPDPAGRALLALLACASEGLSARRFAEYLSLGQVPDPGAPRESAGEPAPPAHDLLPEPPLTGEESVSVPGTLPEKVPLPRDPDAANVVDGSLRAPWRWEQILVDASVIGRKDRWERRLAGLEAELELRRRDLDDEVDVSLASYLDRQIRDVRHLRETALPLIDRLASFPARGSWGEWLAHLRGLAAAALRAPDGVLATLDEIEPMAPVGPVDLDEVQIVLAPRLRELTAPPPRRRYGAVFIAPAESAHGLAFDVVFVPGLAEKLFPRKIVEDPLLPDSLRARLSPDLPAQDARAGAERLALRLAVGAAGRRAFLSYPRVDLEKGRPRVPSFYGLEAMKATEGRLPGFEELRRRAETDAEARLGWPAPVDPRMAIDEAEYDLALLAPLLPDDPETTVGKATYLLGANPHLARALRARARRWLKRWTPSDGLVDPDADALAALARHQLSARSYSPTALQHFAVCPYRFFLQAVHRLEPREEPVAIEVLDPLTRGGLFHEAQFQILTALREGDLLPVRPETLEPALAIVDAKLDAVAEKYRDELCPAIPRVWEDGIGTLRADLRQWLRKASEEADGWVPYRFELSFGLKGHDRPTADPASVPDPVSLDGGLRLRGSIDLVERHARGALRATDHKTGKVRAGSGVVVGGGQVLQPVLYALAIEKLLPEPVESGRLYYCTADGGYLDRVVELNDQARRSARTIVDVVARSLAQGFLPAAPDKGACRWCDFRPVCGPLEEIRVGRKPKDRLEDLKMVRELP